MIRLIYARTTLVNVLLICIEIGIKSKKKVFREKWRFGRIYDDIGVKFLQDLRCNGRKLKK